MTQLLIFDWDGTLCDSLTRIVECLQYAADDVGLPIPDPDSARDIVGLGLREALDRLFPEIRDEQIEKLRVSYSSHFRLLDHNPSPFYPGVLETLHRLKGEGYLLAVATGKSRGGLDRVLAAHGLGCFFDDSRCADETASKPDPLMVRELLQSLAVTPDRSLFIGDTEFDMEMAQRAQVPRIGVSYGAHGAERLKAYDLHACLDSITEIHEHI